MGYFQASEGIDCKGDIKITGSISSTDGISGDLSVGSINSSGNITALNTISGSQAILESYVRIKGIGGTSLYNSNPVVVNPSDGRLYYSDNTSLGDNVTRAVNGSDPLIIRYDTTGITPTDVNGGTLIYMPQDADQSIRFGLAQGLPGPASWNKDFYCTVINTGTNGSANNNWNMGVSVTTPNDGGGNFIIFVVGRQPDGTLRFQYSTAAPGNAFTSTYDIQAGGTLRFAMDYDNRTIVINSDAFA